MIALIAALLAVAFTPGADGRTAYVQQCATCHGTDLRGGPNAPSLRGVGAADVDFWVGTGRMPAAIPWIQVDHRGPQLSPATIDAITQYVTSVAPGGPAIPAVAADGNEDHGRELFRENCMHCHGADAKGGAIGWADYAPPLHRATVTQVGEAVRIGPGQMPRFSEAEISPRDLDDLVTYLSHERAKPSAEMPLQTSGPVPEGFLGWIAAAVLALAAFAYSAADKESGTE